jgi:hypothetical protein
LIIDYTNKPQNKVIHQETENDDHFFVTIEKQANAQFHTLMKTHYPIITKRGTVIEYHWPVKPWHYAWCKICKEKDQILRFQLVESFRILHVNSFFDWKKQTLRKYWQVYDGETDQIHIHTQDRKPQMEVA